MQQRLYGRSNLGSGFRRMGERPEQVIAVNVLDRHFEAAKPNQKWVADFTDILIAEGWVYVSTVINVFYVGL